MVSMMATKVSGSGMTMKKYTKYIFDLDNTLLNPDWSKEDDYFKKHIPTEQQEEFFKQKLAQYFPGNKIIYIV